MSWKDVVRKYCPNYMPLRKFFSRIKIWQSYKYSISQRDISKGEADFESKKQIVEKCARKWPAKIKELDDELSYLLENIPVDEGTSDITNIETDMKFCYFAYGFQLSEYLFYNLVNKNAKKRRQYISDVERIRMAYQMNDVVEYDLLNDKWKTYLKFSKYFSRDVIAITQKDDYGKFDSYTTKHPIFVRKDAYLCKGKSVELVNLPEELHQNGITKQAYFDEMINSGKYVLEEKIEQGEALSKLCPSTVNTVRCLTFYTTKGIVIGFCFLRLGREGSFVDNSSAGGIIVGIDKETGCLNTGGFDKMGKSYSVHPDTKVALNGYQLPEWDHLMGLCKEVSTMLPAIKFIGWDWAYSNNGWVLVEGNGLPQITGPQIIQQKGLKKEVKDIMSQMNLMA